MLTHKMLVLFYTFAANKMLKLGADCRSVCVLCVVSLLWHISLSCLPVCVHTSVLVPHTTVTERICLTSSSASVHLHAAFLQLKVLYFVFVLEELFIE